MKIGKIKFKLSNAQIVAIGFMLAIFLGGVVLSLPISSAKGEFTPFIDALFTSTTSICVTGLVVVNTFEYWSFFGQVVILILIQLGGLGVVAVSTFIMMVIGKKVLLKERMLIQDAYGLETLSGMVKFVKHVFILTMIIEMIGAIIYMFKFIPEFGVGKGIWISVFNAVSAFCNAGIDVIGPSSLMNYTDSPLVNFTTMFLIISGGIGFIVWFDVFVVIKKIKNKEINYNCMFSRLTLHSKLVIVTTLVLIFLGAIFILAFEYNNPLTMNDLPWGEKIMASFFQSVTTRTAGFCTVSQKGLQDATALICILLMFVGGSPVGTAGGIKTISLAVIFIAVVSVIKSKEDSVVFNREIPRGVIRKTLAITAVSGFIVATSLLLLLTLNGGNVLDAGYEVVSAMATVGLTRDFTFTLNDYGKMIIIATMYLGRIGPVTMAIAFNFNAKKKTLMKYSKESVIIG